MIQKKFEKKTENFTCKFCDYNTTRRSQYQRHLSTLKHKKLENDTKKVPFSSAVFVCYCGKRYTHKQNLYRHQKQCYNSIENDNSGCIISQDSLTNEILLKVLHENSEIKSMLIKQCESLQEQQKQVQTENKELQNQIKTLIPKIGNNNIINNTINSKQKFNINIFLGKQCKDALTINEFIDKIKVILR